MIFTLLRRIFREHGGAHLWVPILVVAFLSCVIDLLPFLWSGGQIHWALIWNWSNFWAPWFRDRGRELIGIYLAFIWVVWQSVRKASDVRWTMIGDLSDTLEGADRYFAIGTIPLREWFEPNTLLYLATIIQQQYKRQHHAASPAATTSAAGTPATTTIASASFRHDRVLLFHNDADFKALQASYLDQHYARSFSAIHERFDIGLAYLRPREIREILSKLNPEDRKMLASQRRRTWLFGKLARNAGMPRPFAIIYRANEEVIVGFLKSGNSLHVERIVDELEVKACKALVASIENAIYKPNAAGTASGPELFERYKFSKYLCP